MWSRETVPAGSAHEARFEGASHVDPEIPEESADGGQVALRVRDLIRQIAMEHEISILSGKVASDHIHVLVAYRPHANTNRTVPCDAVNWSVATSSVENVTSE